MVACERNHIQAGAGVLHWPQKGGIKMFKVTANMKCVGMLRGGWDLMEDEDFLYLVDGEKVIASFSVHISLDLLRHALNVIELTYDFDQVK